MFYSWGIWQDVEYGWLETNMWEVGRGLLKSMACGLSAWSEAEGWPPVISLRTIMNTRDSTITRFAILQQVNYNQERQYIYNVRSVKIILFSQSSSSRYISLCDCIKPRKLSLTLWSRQYIVAKMDYVPFSYSWWSLLWSYVNVRQHNIRDNIKLNRKACSLRQRIILLYFRHIWCCSWPIFKPY